MNLTFKGFLRKYVRNVTQLETDSLRRLVAQVEKDAPHAAEILFLFAMEGGKVRHLVDVARKPELEQLFAQMASDSAAYGKNAYLYARSEGAPIRVSKVADAYDAATEKARSDRRVSLLMREKALQGMRAHGITAYRVCKELGLNKGNIYAYLNRANATKVSRSTARRIMEFCCAGFADEGVQMP